MDHQPPRYMQATASSASKRATSSSLSPSSRLSCKSSSSSSSAATEPHFIDQLWSRVMSYRNPTKASRGRQRGYIEEETPTPPSKLNDRGKRTPRASAPVSATATPTFSGRSPPAAKVGDENFRQTVLAHYGVTIREAQWNRNLLVHFELGEELEKPSDRLAKYCEEYPLKAIWLDREGEDDQREYDAMATNNDNEAEFQAYALAYILHHEPRHGRLPEDLRRWEPIRLLQKYQAPGKNKWRIPPVLDPPAKPYGWDIRSDCTYSVSLQAFNPATRPLLRRYVAVVQERAICPYLTIEFTKDEETISAAEQQVAVSSAMALFNRFSLKQEVMTAKKRDWSDADKKHMRHYGLTLMGSYWVLWCITPKTFQNWTGCEMSSLANGDCKNLASMRQFYAVINDIHYWGLNTHGKSIKDDIATIVHSDEDGDPNDISLVDVCGEDDI